MTMTKTIATLSIAALLGVAGTTQADVILSTGFDNSGVSGGEMTGVVWTENGMTAPTTLGASAAVRTGLSGDGDAEGGYFSPNANVNGSTEANPAWTATWTISVGALDAVLTSIEIFSIESNNGASLGAGNGQSAINLTISTFDQTRNRTNKDATGNLLTYTPGAPLTLSANTDYDITLTVWELPNTSQGHFESVDSITFNGSLVPEPASLALIGLGGLMMIRRRGA